MNDSTDPHPHDTPENGDDANDNSGDSKPAAVEHTLVDGLISPVAAANEEHVDEEEEEDDDWSRQVETDETTAGHLLHEDSFRLMESVVEENNNNQQDDSDAMAMPRSRPPQPSSQRELTMKEKLVMRERERRIETERARLKRQFALNNDAADDDDDDNRAGARNSTSHNEALPANHRMASHRAAATRTSAAEQAAASRESEASVTETLGEESIVAHPDEESSANDEERRLGFNMERFLRNSDTFNPQLEPTDEEGGELKGETQNVLMKRFLNEPVVPIAATAAVAEQQQQQRTDVARSVSFEMDGSGTTTPTAAAGAAHHRSTSAGAGGPDEGEGHALSSSPSPRHHHQHHRPVMSAAAMASFGEVSTDSVRADTSVVVQADTEDIIARDRLSTEADLDVQVMGGSDVMEEPSSTTSTADEQPRVLRLTEADMQEMAAIEDASIGNAPPSEREEMLSEIGEMADFSSSHLHGGGGVSLDTPTTAMESGSQISGTQIGGLPLPSDQRSMDDEGGLIGVPTLSSGLVIGSSSLSPRGSANDTVEANPPSETGAREEGIEAVAPILMLDDDESIHDRVHHHHHCLEEPVLLEDGDEVVVVPPAGGMVVADLNDNDETNVSHPVGEHQPASAAATQRPLVVDGFDFDKHAPTSPLPVDNDDSYRALPMDEWSPAGKMGLSPLQPRSSQVVVSMPPIPGSEPLSSYGAVAGTSGSGGGGGGLPLMPESLRERDDIGSGVRDETQPLLSDVPSEIIATRQHTEEKEDEVDMQNTTEEQKEEGGQEKRSKLRKMRSVIKHVLSEVRSEDESVKEAVNQDAELYAIASVFQRAVPERLVALLVTFLFEIPVLLMISGGSDALCALIGRSRYQLLIAFLPLTSAISGNVGLQASTLTTRAISHNQVTITTYVSWLVAEIGVAGILAIGMGIILGSVAYFASGMDFAFGVTIMIAQFVSILTAGFTGTLAPVIFTFIFKRDSGKWGGPLETAVQDIVGSFAMVIISYHVLAWLGPGSIEPGDECGVIEQ